MIKVYTKTNCQPCIFTKRWLIERKITFVEVNIDKQPSTVEEVAALGYTQLPVVVTDGNVWSGFQPDKLEGSACM